MTTTTPATTADEDRTGVGTSLVGAPIRRVEDERFLRGEGAYLADVHLPGTKYLAIVRSTVAHARIVRVDIAAARSASGVVAAFTGPDLARVTNPLSHLLPMPTIKPLEWYVLATDKVRFVGEPVAVVVADSRYLAEDAAELVEVDYDELPVVVDPEDALRDGAPRLYDEWADNVFLSAAYGTGDLDSAFASADGVLRERFRHHRVIGLPLEGHGATAQYDRASGRLLVYASSQQPHNLRTVISDVTGLSEAKIRVVAPDMGGGFGNKQHFMREELLVAAVAQQVNGPVSWVQDRTESLTASVHSRDQLHDVEVAYRNDGRVLAIRARIVADVGNPVLYFTGAAPALVTTSLMTGVYDIPNYAYELQCVATNKCPVGAYRGFGQPQAIFTVERVMDLVASAVGLDPAEVRARNFIPDTPRPWSSPTGAQYDVGSFGEQLDAVLDAVSYLEFRDRQAAARAEGRYVGIGLASMVEATAPNLHCVAGRFGGFEMAIVTIQPDGHVNVVVGTKSQGQGHETAFAQVVADTLTIPTEHVDVQEGDTAVLPYGMGTWGSRSAVMGGGVLLRAARQLRERMRAVAANMLQVDVEAVDLDAGMFSAGEARVPFAAVAGAAYLHTFLLPPGAEPGLSTVVGYDPGNTSAFPDEHGHMNVAATYATAACAVVVEVDPHLGTVRIDDAVIAHYCGTIINPMIVDGQILGAWAQALGSVFLEEVAYDADGQPLSASLLDYRIPTCGGVPRPRVVHREHPSPLEGGFRGAGEAAIIVCPPAIANAIEDALRPLGVAIRQTNLGPARLRALVREHGVPFDALASARALLG
jgi:carbon-monoxide dehydrogenase large subunit